MTLVIGREQRIFAAHEDVLSASPWFQHALSDQYMDPQVGKRIHLPDDEPEIFSSVLEYLYKGDYYPRLIHNKRRNSWELEPLDEERGPSETTIYHHAIDGDILKDTVIYCTADRYGMDELKRVALRKQGLRKSTYLYFLIDSLDARADNDCDRVWHSVQHHPGISPLCVHPYTRHRLKTTSTLPCSHHPQPQHFQAKWYDATRDVQRRDTAVLRSLRRSMQSCR